MHYTISTTTDVHGNTTVNFDKTGNKYLVGFTNSQTKEYTHKEYNSLQEALMVYQKFVVVIIKGEYSYECRKKWLA